MDGQQIAEAAHAFVAGLLNNIKTACSADAILKSVPAIKMVKDSIQNGPLAESVKTLEDSVKAMANLQIDASNADSMKSALESFGNIVKNLDGFVDVVVNNAPSQSGDGQQQNVQQTQQNTQTT